MKNIFLVKLYEDYVEPSDPNRIANLSGKIKTDGHDLEFLFDKDLDPDQIKKGRRSLWLSRKGTLNEIWDLFQRIYKWTGFQEKSPDFVVEIHELDCGILEELGMELTKNRGRELYTKVYQGQISALEGLAKNDWIPSKAHDFSNAQIARNTNMPFAPKSIKATTLTTEVEIRQLGDSKRFDLSYKCVGLTTFMPGYLSQLGAALRL